MMKKILIMVLSVAGFAYAQDAPKSNDDTQAQEAMVQVTAGDMGDCCKAMVTTCFKTCDDLLTFSDKSSLKVWANKHKKDTGPLGTIAKQIIKNYPSGKLKQTLWTGYSKQLFSPLCLVGCMAGYDVAHDKITGTVCPKFDDLGVDVSKYMKF